MHCPKNYINLRIKVRAFYSWNRCNEICLVSEPDRCAKKADLPVCNAYYACFVYVSYCILHMYTFASDPAATGAVFVRRFRLCLGQCDSDYAWDSVIQIMLGTV